MNKSKFQFSNPVLIECHLEINKEYSVDNDDNKIDAPSVEITTQIGDIEDFETTVLVNVKIGNEDENTPFWGKVVMGSVFFWDEALEEEKVKQLLEINATAHLISYTRPIISMLTSMTNYPPFHLPFLDLTDNKKR